MAEPYYLDTSTLVKRYVQETGTAWVRQLVDPARGHNLYTGRLTGPEMVAALSRKAQKGQVTPVTATRAVQSFRRSWPRHYLIIPVTASIVVRAMDLAEVHRLRGYDAVHLAAAMEIASRQSMAGLPVLTFVSADDDQRGAAAAEGLAVENPNIYL